MQRTIVFSLLLGLLLLIPTCSKKGQVAGPGQKSQVPERGPTISLPAGLKENIVSVEAKVEKVFAAESNGCRYRAYQVKWKGHDVVVQDMFGGTDFKAGDTITFMVAQSEVPFGTEKIKTLQFMMMSFSGFPWDAIKSGKPGSSTPPEK